MSDAGVRWEGTVGRWAPPTVLAVAWLWVGTGFGRTVARLCSTMWLHELGHATVSWLCGYPAVPTPWVTWRSDHRSGWTSAVIMASAGWCMASGWKSQRWVRFWGGVSLGVVHGVTLRWTASRVEAWVTFGGDGGALVLAALLMSAFFVPIGSRLHRGALRWGLLLIGALAFADVFRVWWRGRGDLEAIPFGEIEGVGLSDPSRLLEVHGWSLSQLVHRHLAVGIACLLALGLRYGWEVYNWRDSAKSE